MTPSRSKAFVSSAVIVLASAAMQLPGESARADLEAYVKQPDGAFAWKQTRNKTTPAGKVYTIDLTSQVWQGITWKHDLRIFEPTKVVHENAVLLFITGGSTGSSADDEDNAIAFGLTRLTGARVAFLRQVPNQPLLGGKKEDALIAETFIRFLETKDENWPLLFPMAKSAVRAMDAVQAWAREGGKPEVKEFVVTGGSKRGWTSWLAGAVDRRVIGIAPMVIVMLNMGQQGPNQLAVWGKYSEQIEDYVSRGLMEKAQTPEGANVWKLVDPYSYRDRLTIPKMLINGSNDRYWTLNALDLYWEGLEGPKYLVELPNAGHGLEKNRDWALNGLGAFFRHVVGRRPMPRVTWALDRSGGKGTIPSLSINAEPAPVSARLWSADSRNRDFRESKWSSAPLKAGTAITAPLPLPDSGQRAYYADLEYQIDGISYHLTTSFVEPGVVPRKATGPRKKLTPHAVTVEP